jgi:hypothetical protein
MAKREKHVFDTSEIPHLWAHRTQADARNARMTRKIKARQTFGRLRALCEAKPDSQGHSRWKFECVCGNRRIVRIDRVLDGRVRSCGCIGVELLIERNRERVW